MGRKNVTPIESGAGFIGSLASKLVKCLRQKGMADEKIYDLVRECEVSDEMISKIADALFMAKKEISRFLKLISGSESLELDDVDGSEIIAGSNDMFKSGIDSDFINWKADEKGSATRKISVAVYETVKDATFSQMFSSLNADARKFCLTQHQIKNFVKKHRKWLRTGGYATFFLFESNGHFFVAYVFMDSEGSLYVRVCRFEDSSVWDAWDHPRVVVPQLA